MDEKFSYLLLYRKVLLILKELLVWFLVPNFSSVIIWFSSAVPPVKTITVLTNLPISYTAKFVARAHIYTYWYVFRSYELRTQRELLEVVDNVVKLLKDLVLMSL